MEVIRHLVAERWQVTAEDLAQLSPYLSSHIRAFTGLTPTRYVEVRRQFLHEHPGHVLDSWPLPAD